MVTVEERLSRIEGGYEHVATKADVAEIKAEIATARAENAAAIAQIDAKLTAAIADNKAELAAAIAGNKAEFAAAIAQIDAKLSAGIARNGEAIAELRSAMKILLWGGGVLGVLSAGVLAAVIRLMLM